MRAQSVVLAAVGAGLVSGCAGPMFEGTIFEQPARRDPEVARIVVNTQQTNLEVRQLAEQLAAFSRNQEILEGRLTRLESQLAAGAGAQDEITALRRDMQLLRSERDALKKEITDDLAARVEKIAARQQADIQAARAASSAPAASTRAPAAAGSPASGRAGYEHRVEKGQTLSVIARGYGKSVDAIMKANKLTNPSNIRAGQVLFIPD